MLTGPNPSDLLNQSHPSPQDITIDSILDDLSTCLSRPKEFVNTPKWNQIPLLIKEWKEGKDEDKMFQLLTSLNVVLTEVSLSEIPLHNKRLLHSSLSSLTRSPTLHKRLRLRLGHCLTSLDSIMDGPFVLLATSEVIQTETTLADLTRANTEHSTRIRQLEEEVAVLRQSLLDFEKQKVERREAEEKQKEARYFKISGLGMLLSYDMGDITRSGNTLTRHSAYGWSSLLSVEIGPVVARFSLVLGKNPNEDTQKLEKDPKTGQVESAGLQRSLRLDAYRRGLKTSRPANIYVGLVATKRSAKSLKNCFPELLGGAGWCISSNDPSTCQNNWTTNSKRACWLRSPGQKIVLEADGREGRRTLKLSQNGQAPPTFFSNIPVPFRFAVSMNTQNDSVIVESLEFVREPQVIGGTVEVVMDEEAKVNMSELSEVLYDLDTSPSS
ncbi:hypothetical protein BLNAU_23136 [Blattamonas nauphoetae]|uniref:Uncharacterized protein n=1 Tax=Blattamonas nauphoetae TaxID=2049346 RepID=A0ABQ9WR35_9EUKA|nr:hypothetical protein BLNAU_23136 [Blattamonas nauphoetae]